MTPSSPVTTGGSMDERHVIFDEAYVVADTGGSMSSEPQITEAVAAALRDTGIAEHMDGTEWSEKATAQAADALISALAARGLVVSAAPSKDDTLRDTIRLGIHVRNEQDNPRFGCRHDNQYAASWACEKELRRIIEDGEYRLAATDPTPAEGPKETL